MYTVNFNGIKFLYKFLISVALTLTLSCSAQENDFDFALNEGIYDGNIGSEKVIFIVENSEDAFAKGFYIINKGNAVEEPQPFTLTENSNSLEFKSEQYAGEVKLKKNASNFDGTLLLSNQKKRFLFFRVRVEIELSRRSDEKIEAPISRYQKALFDEVDVQRNILYGHNYGYWIDMPQQDQPYIEMIAKGLVKASKELEDLNLKMDIYQPKGDTLQQRPLILFIHGGAFYMGSKQCDTAQELAKTFAKEGYVVACIDYRLGFKLNGEEIDRSGYRAIQDAHAALRFLAHNASKYRIDPDQIYVSGTSAGAIASLNVAFMTNDERPESTFESRKRSDLGNIETSGNTLTDRFTIKSVANMWGAVTAPEIIDPNEKKSVISIHGTADDIVPYGYDFPFQKARLINKLIMNKIYGSKSIHERLDQLNFRNKLISLEGQKHEPHHDEFSNFNQYMDTIKNEVSLFFYQETAPTLVVPKKQLTIKSQSPIEPLNFEIENGDLAMLEVTGGIKVSGDADCSSIIWFSNEKEHKFTLYSTNKFGAWNIRNYNVTIEN